MGWNILHSLTYNFGMNMIGAGLGTWAFIETGLDWQWRNISYHHTWLTYWGRPGLYMGYIVPALTPLLTYTIGRFTEDRTLQITGMALTQTLMVTLLIQTPLKMVSGRALPGIVTELDHTRNSRSDNFSNEFNWCNNNFIGGWPSGHTANAFAAAATLSELYHENWWFKIGLFSYASLIGLGVTLDVHWASEAFAGALIGYAVGKTVGKSFRKLLEGDTHNQQLSFSITPNSIGLIIHLPPMGPREEGPPRFGSDPTARDKYGRRSF
ncbi:MAG: phosphatase PAP2 family protein [Spirochaetaceae bacterium]|jgi:membrane-associated phospholipid phosphatase|nr:phosphatase PAP2 family protein [Spirochaetaceae bacterium]